MIQIDVMNMEFIHRHADIGMSDFASQLIGEIPYPLPPKSMKRTVIDGSEQDLSGLFECCSCGDIFTADGMHTRMDGKQGKQCIDCAAYDKSRGKRKKK